MAKWLSISILSIQLGCRRTFINFKPCFYSVSAITKQDLNVVKKVVGEDEDGMRFDRFVSEHFPAITQGFFHKMLRKKKIQLETRNQTQTALSGAYRLQKDDIVSVPEFYSTKEKPKLQAKESDKQEIIQRILYKDDQIIAINKKSGMAVQGGTKVNLHLLMTLEALQFDKEEYPRLAHRLDKDTSGVLLLGRTRKSTTRLMHIFKGRHGIQKEYWAFLSKKPVQRKGRILLPITKEPDRYPNMNQYLSDAETNSSEFQKAITEFEVVHSLSKMGALVKFYPETGRKHQIRIHSSFALKAPILGDKKYSVLAEHFQEFLGEDIPLHLHLRRITLKDWKGEGKDLTITCPFPPHMIQTFKKFQIDNKVWNT